MTYNVTIEPEDGYWNINIPAVGRATQAKALKDVDATAKELINIMTGEENPAINVEMNLPESVAEAARLKERTAIMEARTQSKQREAVKILRAKGITFRDIGKAMGISYQRAHQLAG